MKPLFEMKRHPSMEDDENRFGYDVTKLGQDRPRKRTDSTASLNKLACSSRQAVTIGQKFLVRPAYCLSYLKIFRRSGLLPVQSYLPIGANLPIGQLAANRQSDKIGQLAEFRQLDQHFLGFFLYKKLLLET
ncbi:unnamed protein product [Oikopleura dioica]|uniref:Uncharacterized protein n=1 Tax=Oikopleura dioica TaxID=34765 RepID=E4YCW7_OIKDI|nr:unnamed protein product [Oikopleura dioica]